MIGALDVVVVGGGPAGVAAAVTAHALGLRCVLIDEQPAAGGQVYRPAAFAPIDGSPGAALRGRLTASDVPTRFGARVWSAERGFAVGIVDQSGGDVVTARGLILATGAQERVAPVTGWTLPGVIGLAAATALIKSQGVLPGRHVVVSGRGALLLLVAALILERGGTVAAVIDANPIRAWMARPGALLSRPDLIREGLGWATIVARHRVPIYFGHAITAMHGDGAADTVRIQRVGGGPPVTIDCDAVCHGDGLASATELTRMLGADHAFRSDLGGWTVTTDAVGRTSVPGLFACGDGAGIVGAAAAPLRGEIAALALASDLGAVSAPDVANEIAPRRVRLRRAARFGAAMTALAPADTSFVRHAGPETLICRCEGITRRTIEAAVDAGAGTANAVKAATRCGMGPCGARFCADAAAAIIALRLGCALGEVAPMTGRPPARPLPLAAIMGDFGYDDIPLAEPAPV